MSTARRNLPIAERCEALAPIVAPSGRVLILGSMPGRVSLLVGQYYAHPQNRFWRIMGELAPIAAGLPYPARIAALTAAGVSLWDVLQSCVRPGSLDSAITDEVANDFATFLREHRAITHICFNGAKAAQAFHRRVLPTLDRPDLALHLLPSSSPANARLSFAQALAAWRSVVVAALGARA